MHLTILKNKLIRRLNVNLVAYLGEDESGAMSDNYLKPTTSKEWFDGKFKFGLKSNRRGI